jgi:hypothetical protein
LIKYKEKIVVQKGEENEEEEYISSDHGDNDHDGN